MHARESITFILCKMRFLKTNNVMIFREISKGRGNRERAGEGTRVSRVEGEGVDIVREEARDGKRRGRKREGTPLTILTAIGHPPTHLAPSLLTRKGRGEGRGRRRGGGQGGVRREGGGMGSASREEGGTRTGRGRGERGGSAKKRVRGPFRH